MIFVKKKKKSSTSTNCGAKIFNNLICKSISLSEKRFYFTHTIPFFKNQNYEVYFTKKSFPFTTKHLKTKSAHIHNCTYKDSNLSQTVIYYDTTPETNRDIIPGRLLMQPPSIKRWPSLGSQMGGRQPDRDIDARTYLHNQPNNLFY